MICDLQVARSVFATQWPDVVIHPQNLRAETHNKLILEIAFWVFGKNGPVFGSSFFGYNVYRNSTSRRMTMNASYTGSPKVAQAECLFVATLQDKDKEVGCGGTVEQQVG